MQLSGEFVAILGGILTLGIVLSRIASAFTALSVKVERVEKSLENIGGISERVARIEERLGLER